VNTAELQVIALAGGPRERGRMHGEILKERIVELLERWREFLARSYGVEPARYLSRFEQDAAYEETSRKSAPRILEEVRGIAEGSGVSYRELLAFQHVNEEFELARASPARARRRARHAAPSPPGPLRRGRLLSPRISTWRSSSMAFRCCCARRAMSPTARSWLFPSPG
jgi:hypothetical protein